MPTITVSDSKDHTLDINVQPTNASALSKYLKSSTLDIELPDNLVGLLNLPLSAAAPKPAQFQASVNGEVQFGNTNVEIDVKPSASWGFGVNATAGSNLFDGDPFPVASKVPPATAYVSSTFQGSLDFGASGSFGDLTFGFDANAEINGEYLKAFPLGANEPNVATAIAQTLSSFVIPADVSDLAALGINDIATVSGQGSLKVSGGASVSVSPNPLASVDLPLALGKIQVKAGATAGVSASFTLSGSYQLRTRRLDADTIEMSIVKETGTDLELDLSASAGITVMDGDTDLIAKVLNAISTDPTSNQQLLNDLQPEETKTLAGAIKGGLSHSLEASLDWALSSLTDDQAAFQYWITPAMLNSEGLAAVHHALDGDLSDLTQLEAESPNGNLAPGIRMINSVFSKMLKHGSTLKINLLGILNYVTVSELIRNSEVITDNTTGDITIKETVTGNRISAIVDPLRRSEALRKVMFDSLLATTGYRASDAVAFPNLECEQVHFAVNQNTNEQIMSDYLRWFVAMDLLTKQEAGAILAKFTDGGPSSCVLRFSLDNNHSAAMFYNVFGEPVAKAAYLEIGRQALRALLDPDHQSIDALRYRILDDDLWPRAVQIGASPELGELVGLNNDDPSVVYLTGDVFDIVNWAEGMASVGGAVLDLKNFIGNADLTALQQNNQFKKKRDALQKAISNMVKSSAVRFDEPWGMVSLYWAGGSPETAYGKAVTRNVTIERGAAPAAQAMAA